MALQLKVTYINGREEIVSIRPPALMATEKRFKRDGGLGDRNKIEGTYFMAWYALNKSGKEEADFDSFLELIESAEDYEDESEDPTGPAPPLDESSS